MVLLTCAAGAISSVVGVPTPQSVLFEAATVNASELLPLPPAPVHVNV